MLQRKRHLLSVIPTAVDDEDDGDDSDNVARKAAAEYLPTSVAYVIMNPDHPEPLMPIPIQLNNIEVTALVDNAATLNFISKEFVESNDLMQHCKPAPKVAVRVANSQRLSATKILVPEHLTINDIDYLGIQFYVLPHMKCADLILGLPAQKAMDMIIRPKDEVISIAGVDVHCIPQVRRVSCLLIYGDKLEKTFRKASRAKKQTSNFFVISLQLAERIASITSDYGPE